MVNVIREEKWFLGFLFLISFIIRSLVFSGYLAHDTRYWQVDSNTYDVVAQGIAAGTLRDGPLGSSSGRAGYKNGKPNFYRLPGYPVFLAAYYKLFATNQKNVLWMQVVLAAFIPLLIFFLSLSLFPKHLL